MKKMMTAILMTMAFQGFAQTKPDASFTRTEQLAGYIRDKISITIEDIENETRSDNLPHADYDRKRSEFIKKMNVSLQTFEKNVQNKIIKRLEYLATSYRSTENSNYDEIERNELKSSIIEQAVVEATTLSSIYEREIEILYGLLGESLPSQTKDSPISDRGYGCRYAIDINGKNITGHTSSYYDRIPFTAFYTDIRKLTAEHIKTQASLNCYTWACPNMSRLMMKQWYFSLRKNVDKNINFKLGSQTITIQSLSHINSDVASIIEEQIKKPITDTKWSNLPFEIEESELEKQIMNGIDLTGKKSEQRLEAERKDAEEKKEEEEKKKEREARLQSMKNVAWEIKNIQSLKQCQKEVKYYASVNYYLKYPLTSDEKAKIASDLGNLNKKQAKCFAVLKGI